MSLRRTFVAASLVGGLSGCGLSGADPTGTAAMIQFEQHRRESVRMQQQVTSAEHAAEIETNMRNAIEYCRANIEVDGCRQAVADEAKTMQTIENMKKIGAR